MPNPYDLTTYDGNRVDWITRAALEDVERDLGRDTPLNVSQGSYSAGFAPSGGTHDGGGTVDIIPVDLAEARRIERALRRRGFAAYVRLPIAGLWSLHVHAVLMGNRKLAPSAAAQVREYLLGGDGLKGSAPDTGPRDFLDVRYRWQRGDVRIARARRRIDAALADLAAYNTSTGAGVRGYAVGATRKALRKARAELPTIPDRK